jgi:hypothetical protein
MKKKTKKPKSFVTGLKRQVKAAVAKYEATKTPKPPTHDENDFATLANAIMHPKQQNVIAVGGWPSNAICPKAPEPKYKWQTRKHRLHDVSSKPSGRAGELLVTSQCEYCGGLVVDCPTIRL